MLILFFIGTLSPFDQMLECRAGLRMLLSGLLYRFLPFRRLNFGLRIKGVLYISFICIASLELQARFP